jgi:UPF0042 nucleotide-binding protein
MPPSDILSPETKGGRNKVEMIAKKIRLVIVSGLSGSGRSSALRCFEDSGFFCIDNLPPQLITKFMDLCTQPGSDVSHVALGIDIRSRDFLDEFLNVYESLLKDGFPVEMLFMDAKDEILVRRFSESRRPHPLVKDRLVIDGILEERAKLAELRKRANQIIDTSAFSLPDLKEAILHQHVKKESRERLHISLLSFGYKYGLPYGLDLLFDVRFLRNPYFQKDLRPLSGEDKPIQDFILALPETTRFMEKLNDFLDFLIPLYEKEGKSYLTIGIGCTGGRHRSVTLVNLLRDTLKQNGHAARLSCFHRDISHTPVEDPFS